MFDIRKKYCARVAAWLLVVSTVPVLVAQRPSIRVEGAWMREPPRSSVSSAAYGTIVNDSDRPVSIVSGRSKMVKTIELHEMSMEGDMMHMRKIDTLVVRAHGRVELKAGGTHLMFFGVTGPLLAGGRLDISLRTADGQDVPVAIDVRKAESAP